MLRNPRLTRSADEIAVQTAIKFVYSLGDAPGGQCGDDGAVMSACGVDRLGRIVTDCSEGCEEWDVTPVGPVEQFEMPLATELLGACPRSRIASFHGRENLLYSMARGVVMRDERAGRARGHGSVRTTVAGNQQELHSAQSSTCGPRESSHHHCMVDQAVRSINSRGVML